MEIPTAPLTTMQRLRGVPRRPGAAQQLDRAASTTSARRRRTAVVGSAVLATFAIGGLAGCSTEPNLHDLPPAIAAAKPDITAEQASFVLDADRQGAAISAASLDDDLESGTTTCWALKNGGIQLGQLAVDDQNRPLGNSGDALRTKVLMAAGVRAFCPDYSDQIGQLKLP